MNCRIYVHSIYCLHLCDRHFRFVDLLSFAVLCGSYLRIVPLLYFVVNPRSTRYFFTQDDSLTWNPVQLWRESSCHWRILITVPVMRYLDDFLLVWNIWWTKNRSVGDLWHQVCYQYILFAKLFPTLMAVFFNTPTTYCSHSKILSLKEYIVTRLVQKTTEIQWDDNILFVMQYVLSIICET